MDFLDLDLLISDETWYNKNVERGTPKGPRRKGISKMVNVFKHVDDRFIVVKGDYHDDILPFTIWLNDTNDLIQPGDDIENVINVLPTTYYIINNEPTNSVVYVDSKVLDDLDAYIDETEGTEGDPFEVNTKRVLREIYEQGRRIIGFDEN